MSGKRGFEVILGPGDVLYNPASWWHHVVNLDPSIGFGFRWFDIRQSLKQDAMKTCLTFLSTNPNIITSTLMKNNFTKVLNKKKS